jgi:hypothetical protein
MLLLGSFNVFIHNYLFPYLETTSFNVESHYCRDDPRLITFVIILENKLVIVIRGLCDGIEDIVIKLNETNTILNNDDAIEDFALDKNEFNVLYKSELPIPENEESYNHEINMLEQIINEKMM